MFNRFIQSAYNIISENLQFKSEMFSDTDVLVWLIFSYRYENLR